MAKKKEIPPLKVSKAEDNGDVKAINSPPPEFFKAMDYYNLLAEQLGSKHKNAFNIGQMKDVISDKKADKQIVDGLIKFGFVKPVEQEGFFEVVPKIKRGAACYQAMENIHEWFNMVQQNYMNDIAAIKDVINFEHNKS